ncbi:transducin family protein / WD-40 repeat family protein [Striga asiatica]|uniref:Transducin family protein / WD-40 repeat family protein n=1 Tax=Striga asiatica TaxID=4170 RepID=A0A5A7R183_STRAF|nr:transducin family protein / WD-40 repeat family protein [Striga asiatica]
MQRKMQSSGIEFIIKNEQTCHIKHSEKRGLAKNLHIGPHWQAQNDSRVESHGSIRLLTYLLGCYLPCNQHIKPVHLIPPLEIQYGWNIIPPPEQVDRVVARVIVHIRPYK